MVAVQPYLLTDQNICRQTHLDIGRNSYVRFRQNSSSGFGGDVIMVKNPTRPLREHLGQVLTKSDQWSRRRCDNEIVTVLSDGQLAILKMAAIRPYLLMDQNRFRADTSRHWEEFICKVSTKFLQWFRRRCDKGENQRWLLAAIFVDRPESFFGVRN